ncbi:hypothetical protein RclHR1_04310012 [Rhizophagus clarus]|uniref:Uncharacterized protein n=1 Tax=Rhizophagus clarus TaxID=94130 RepID=A0A2Z6RI70_9GLOM|nr:hypothetical protein RclHR1_04310012 [Rhizophagus clarus]
MSKNVDWNEWIEDAISKKLIKYYEYKDFSNIQEIGTGVKVIAREIQLHREVDHHDNVVRFHGVTTSIKGIITSSYYLIYNI